MEPCTVLLRHLKERLSVEGYRHGFRRVRDRFHSLSTVVGLHFRIFDVNFRRNRTEESTARAGNEAQSNWATEPPPRGPRVSISECTVQLSQNIAALLLGSAATAMAFAASSMALDQVTNHAGQTAVHVRPGRPADLVHLRRRSVHSHRVEGDVQRPRPEA